MLPKAAELGVGAESSCRISRSSVLHWMSDAKPVKAQPPWDALACGDMHATKRPPEHRGKHKGAAPRFGILLQVWARSCRQKYA
eukprot:scaffold49877_cov66-Phaeocystis_antarctica.AAC.6